MIEFSGMFGADCLPINHPLSFSTLEEDNKEALLSSYSSSCNPNVSLVERGL